jgi:hypothetical protein
MASTRQPVFTPDWPAYAVAAHMAFWVTTALMTFGWFGAAYRIVEPHVAIKLFFVWLAATAALGLSAMASGKLYRATNVFSRKPFVGRPAKLSGGFVFLGALVVMAICHRMLFLP